MTRCLGDLYKNSFFLIMSTLLNAGFGFFFWIIASRMYPIRDVGFATVLISSLGLIILFSRFGFDISIIRFFPVYDKTKVFNTSLLLTSVLSIIAAIIGVLLISFLTPNASFIKYPVLVFLFILICIMNSAALITGNTFTANRRADFYFYQNILLAFRIPFLIPLMFLGSFGILGSLGLAYFIASVFAILILKKFHIIINLRVDREFLRNSVRYSLYNYVSNILSAAPALILPLIVSNMLGETEAAKYYIAYTVGNLVLIIPSALSTSLLVEGSYGTKLRKDAIKSGAAIFALLVPSVILMSFFGKLILGLFNRDYIDAFELLRILTLSSFLVALYSIFIPIQNVRMMIESIVGLNLLRFVLLLGLSYILILRYGILGVGYAWTITYMIIDLIIIGILRKELGFMQFIRLIVVKYYAIIRVVFSFR